MIRALAVLLATASIVQAADPQICRPYATATTQTVMNYLWLRAYTSCLNSDETPIPPPDWQSAMRIILPDDPPATDQSKIGTVPATDKPIVVTPVKSVAHWSSPSEICSRSHRHVVWRGKSWRCQ